MAEFLVITFIESPEAAKEIFTAITDATGLGSTILTASHVKPGEGLVVEDEFGVAENIDSLLSRFEAAECIVLTAVPSEDAAKKVKTAVQKAINAREETPEVMQIVLKASITRGIAKK